MSKKQKQEPKKAAVIVAAKLSPAAKEARTAANKARRMEKAKREAEKAQQKVLHHHRDDVRTLDQLKKEAEEHRLDEEYAKKQALLQEYANCDATREIAAFIKKGPGFVSKRMIDEVRKKNMMAALMKEATNGNA